MVYWMTQEATPYVAWSSNETVIVSTEPTASGEAVGRSPTAGRSPAPLRRTSTDVAKLLPKLPSHCVAPDARTRSRCEA